MIPAQDVVRYAIWISLGIGAGLVAGIAWLWFS